jgi:hypothetical protein
MLGRELEPVYKGVVGPENGFDLDRARACGWLVCELLLVFLAASAAS